MMLRRWAVVKISFPEHISGCTFPIVFKFYTQPPSCAFCGRYMNLGLLLVQYCDLFGRFDTHFVSGADLKNYWADD